MSAIEARHGADGQIMVIDDNPANLRLLESALKPRGYRVRSFPDGGLALMAAAHERPDLILLDVNMPELNGYEVCARLKADRELSTIPVIFLSALGEIEDKVKAFQSGGVDYISKPFQFEEVYARVETHLKLYDFQRALKRQNDDLEETVASRTRELADAHVRLTRLDEAKSDFLKIISHELRTPLNGLLGVGEILLDELSPTAELNDLRQLFERTRQRILSLLDNAQVLIQIDVEAMRFQSSLVSLSSVLNGAIERASEFAESRQVTLAPVSADLGYLQGDEELLVGALHALLETAVKFSAENETIRLSHKVVPPSIQLLIESHGRTIPTSAIPRFFDIFSIGEAITPGGDLGLGPPMACRILSLFGATVSVSGRKPSGIRLTLQFKEGSKPL
jgi:DNA-binding response OmpR family regulator